MKNNEFYIRPYTIKQLAVTYNCSTKTLRKWLEILRPNLGERMGHFYNPRQVRMIIEFLGAPFVWIFCLLLFIIEALESAELDYHQV